LQAADQPLTSPAANLNAVLGNLAGLDSLKAIFKRMPGHGAAYPPRAWVPGQPVLANLMPSKNSPSVTEMAMELLFDTSGTPCPRGWDRRQIGGPGAAERCGWSRFVTESTLSGQFAMAVTQQSRPVNGQPKWL